MHAHTLSHYKYQDNIAKFFVPDTIIRLRSLLKVSTLFYMTEFIVLTEDGSIMLKNKGFYPISSNFSIGG